MPEHATHQHQNKLRLLLVYRAERTAPLWPMTTILGFIFLVISVANAQPVVNVNGVQLERVQVIEGLTHVAADELAHVLGAQSQSLQEDTLLWQWSGHLKQFTSRQLDDDPYVNLQSVIAAFGGRLLSTDSGLIALMPRAALESFAVTALDAGGTTIGDRIVLNFSHPTAFQVQRLDNGSFQVSFLRSDITTQQGNQFSGRRFSLASLIEGTDSSRLSMTASVGSAFDYFVLPRAQGFQFVLDITSSDTQQMESVSQTDAPTIVLDAGHGGGDMGLQFPEGLERELSLGFVQSLAVLLDTAGFEVRLTRDQNIAVPAQARAALALDADLFLSVHASRDQETVLYQQDMAATPLFAIQENIASELGLLTFDDPRREVLETLGAIDNPISLGTFQRLLGQDMRFVFEDDANLLVLSAAPKHSLMLELPAARLQDEETVNHVAESIEALFRRDN